MQLSRPDFVQRYDERLLGAEARQLYRDSPFYNVGYWEKGTRDLSEASASLLRRLATLISDSGVAPRIIADIGCGIGGGAEVVRDVWPEASTVSVNLSLGQLLEARRRQPRLTPLVSDATHLGLADGSIDAIICAEAAFHFDTRRDFLSDALRVVTRDGVLALSDIVFRDPSAIGEWMVPPANRVASPREYLRVCEEVGWSVEHVRDVTSSTWIPFCRHLEDEGMAPQACATLARSVESYLLLMLRKGT